MQNPTLLQVFWRPWRTGLVTIAFGAMATTMRPTIELELKILTVKHKSQKKAQSSDEL